MDRKDKKKAKIRKKLDLKRKYKEKHPEEFPPPSSSSSEEEECCSCSGESVISRLQRQGIIGSAFRNPIDAIIWCVNQDREKRKQFESVAHFWNNSPQKSVCDFNTQKLVFSHNQTYGRPFSCSVCESPYIISRIEITMDEKNSSIDPYDLYKFRRIRCDNCGEYKLLSSFIERMGGKCGDHAFKENPELFM